jgi:hypothetical protein
MAASASLSKQQWYKNALEADTTLSFSGELALIYQQRPARRFLLMKGGKPENYQNFLIKLELDLGVSIFSSLVDRVTLTDTDIGKQQLVQRIWMLVALLYEEIYNGNVAGSLTDLSLYTKWQGAYGDLYTQIGNPFDTALFIQVRSSLESRCVPKEYREFVNTFSSDIPKRVKELFLSHFAKIR